MAEDFPVVMDQLERWAPATGFAFGAEPGLADFSVASHFTNLRWARQTVDDARWPKTSAWIARVDQHACVAPLNTIGERLLRVPPDGQRPVLAAMGVAVTAETVGGRAPQRGPMTRL